MKHYYLLLIYLGISIHVLAQTNTFPTSGNVGIGTTNPGHQLTVKTSRTLDGVQIEDTNGKWINIFSPNLTEGGYNDITDLGDAGIIFGTHGGVNTVNYGLVIAPHRSDGSSGLRITSTGNIGIGIRNPTEKLVVNGNITSMLDPAINPEKNVAGIVNLGYSGITGARNWAIRGVYQHWHGVHNNSDGGDLDIIKSLNGNTILGTKTDGSPLGNIGIGTTDPGDYKLAVNGRIRSREVKVELSNWPDYVFEKDYALPSLQETADFIKQNKHLPGIPSAREVEQEGISLGEMNAKLLKKIEELTLHLIRQEKELMELKQKVERGKQKG